MILRLCLLKSLKEVSRAHQGFIYLIGNTGKLLYYEILHLKELFSILKSSVSHDPSEIILICWFAAQETWIIIIDVDYSCAA